MVERYKRGKGKKSLLGSHQKCWLWGRHLVRETLEAGRWPMADLYLAETLDGLEQQRCRERAERLGATVTVGPPALLEKLGHTGEHQGYLARMREFPYTPRVWLDERLAGGRPVFLVMLDGIQDPHNLGAILRSAEVFGVDAVLIPERGQTGVTSQAARSSAGAVNRVPVIRVDSLEAEAAALARRGVRVAGSSEKADCAVTDVDFQGAVCVAIGNEGRGLGEGLLARCAVLTRIPQYGRVGSLNAAVAAGILFYEVRRQRAAVIAPGASGPG